MDQQFELTLSQQFELRKYKDELESCNDVEVLKDLLLKMMEQSMRKNNYWVSQIRL